MDIFNRPTVNSGRASSMGGGPLESLVHSDDDDDLVPEISFDTEESVLNLDFFNTNRADEEEDAEAEEEEEEGRKGATVEYNNNNYDTAHPDEGESMNPSASSAAAMSLNCLLPPPPQSATTTAIIPVPLDEHFAQCLASNAASATFPAADRVPQPSPNTAPCNLSSTSSSVNHHHGAHETALKKGQYRNLVSD